MPPPSMDDQRRMQHGVGVSVGGDSEKSSNNNDGKYLIRLYLALYYLILIFILLYLSH